MRSTEESDEMRESQPPTGQPGNDAEHEGLETGQTSTEGRKMTGSGSTERPAAGTGGHDGLESDETTEEGRKMTAQGSRANESAEAHEKG
jgi:hypothetical protein